MPSLKFKNHAIKLGMPLLRLLPAEDAHNLGALFLKSTYGSKSCWLPGPAIHDDQLDVDLGPLGKLSHPLGLAAGFTKNADMLEGLRNLSFSFIEAGTVTPKPQTGNPRPRMFRYREKLALINRMGFNNRGIDAFLANSLAFRTTYPNFILGFNLGKNLTTPVEKALDDYAYLLEKTRNRASYYVINISSPNTPQLRKLATSGFLDTLADVCQNEQKKIWIKLDPDRDRRDFQGIIESISRLGFGGIILSNTHRVETPEPGGLSGYPLASLSCSLLEWAWEVHKGSLPMISVGGIFSGLDVYQRLIRGAQAVQIYTSFVYGGPWVVPRILEELKAEMALHGVSSLRQIIGTYYSR